MFKAAIITASDKGAQGLREDLSGPCIKKILEEANYEVVSIDILPDDRNLIADKLIELSDRKIPLILTTGGTGFAPRDNTPEATRDVIEKETPGISEAIRAESLKITPRAMLSRAVYWNTVLTSCSISTVNVPENRKEAFCSLQRASFIFLKLKLLFVKFFF